MKHSLHTVLLPRYHVYLIDVWTFSRSKSFNTLQEAKQYGMDCQLKQNKSYFITKEVCL